MTLRGKSPDERHEDHLRRMAPGSMQGTSKVGSPGQGKRGRGNTVSVPPPGQDHGHGHTELSGVTADDHHGQAHSDADHDEAKASDPHDDAAHTRDYDADFVNGTGDTMTGALNQDRGGIGRFVQLHTADGARNWTVIETEDDSGNALTYVQYGPADFNRHEFRGNVRLIHDITVDGEAHLKGTGHLYQESWNGWGGAYLVGRDVNNSNIGTGLIYGGTSSSDRWLGFSALNDDNTSTTWILLHSEDDGFNPGQLYMRGQNEVKVDCVNGDIILVPSGSGETRVEGDFTTTGAKNARVTDPETGSSYRFAADESPHAGRLTFDYHVTVVDRQATVELPEYVPRICRDPWVRTPHPQGHPGTGAYARVRDDWTVEVVGPPGDYVVEVVCYRNDPAVAEWEHEVAA